MGAKDVLDVSKEHDWEPPEAEDFNDPEMMEVPVEEVATKATKATEKVPAKKPADAKQQK